MYISAKVREIKCNFVGRIEDIMEIVDYNERSTFCSRDRFFLNKNCKNVVHNLTDLRWRWERAMNKSKEDTN